MYDYYDYRDLLDEKDYRSPEEILLDEIGEVNYRIVQEESRYLNHRRRSMEKQAKAKEQIFCDCLQQEA